MSETHTCAKAEELAALARKGDWKVELEYFSGETETTYDDGSTYVRADERAGVLIADSEWDDPGFAVVWVRNENTGRWRMLGKAKMLYRDVEYDLYRVSFITEMVSRENYRDYMLWTGRNALGESIDEWDGVGI